MWHLWGEAETHNRGERSQELVLCSRHKATSPELSEHFFSETNISFKKNVFACSMWQKPLQYFFDLYFVLSIVQSYCSSPSATGWDGQIIPLVSSSELALWQAIRQRSQFVVLRCTGCGRSYPPQDRQEASKQRRTSEQIVATRGSSASSLTPPETPTIS